MTVKTTLSFTDRHHAFLAQKVSEGVFATTSSAVAAAIENLIEAEEEQQAMVKAVVTAMADEIRERMKSPPEDFIPADEVFAEIYADLDRRERG